MTLTCEAVKPAPNGNQWLTAVKLSKESAPAVANWVERLNSHLQMIRRHGWFRILAIATLTAMLTGAVSLDVTGGRASADQIPTATAARLGGDIERTRFVIDLTSPVGFSVYVLPDPFRVIIDLPEVNFQLPPGLGSQGRGLVTAYRYGLFEAGKSRIVLDVPEPVLIQESFVLKPENGQPARLVVDLVRTDRETYNRIHELVDRSDADREQAGETEVPPEVGEQHYLANAPLPQPNPLRSGELTPERLAEERAQFRSEGQRPARRTIVLDPGHGGVDPGAVGRRGTAEKRVVFEFAKALRDRLEATGRYDVVLTRETDTFVRLGDRVTVARENNADLFLAIHADALRTRSVRGATAYTLSERASDREAEALAQRENKADLIAGVDLVEESSEVAGILIDLAQRETNNLSVDFAKKIVAALDGVTRLTRRPHRVAGFRVLKAPDVPSVLLELGYISNRQDESLLMQAEWRNKTTAAVVRAIDRYFSSQVAGGAAQ